MKYIALWVFLALLGAFGMALTIQFPIIGIVVALGSFIILALSIAFNFV